SIKYKMNVLPLLLVLLLALGHMPTPSMQYGESDQFGNPTWNEREGHVILNAIRMDLAPREFVNKYFPKFMSDGFLDAVRFPAVDPVYMSNVNSLAARAHSIDMADNNCLRMDDCNGTSWAERIQKLITPDCMGGIFSEVIAGGISSGIQVNMLLLCERFSPPCEPDASPFGQIQDRANMLSANFHAVGVGYSYSPKSDFRHYWTQDFTGAVCAPQMSPIYGGSHTFAQPNLIYMANWKGDGQVAASIHIQQPGVTNVMMSYSLMRDLGEDALGTYSFNAGTSFTECQLYVFTFVDSHGNTYRYPDTGSLATVVSQDSKCQSWSSTDILAPHAATPASTVASMEPSPSFNTPSELAQDDDDKKKDKEDKAKKDKENKDKKDKEDKAKKDKEDKGKKDKEDKKDKDPNSSSTTCMLSLNTSHSFI
ncbi:hypothetical protein SAMD00019534_015750, partial [Acytostelium subglobosum LB1]|uniref:hypothetical protein n=1 Tax=Acytostelium subglobosum LB1 TaxID=1410327 RepID=UPI000644FAAD